MSASRPLIAVYGSSTAQEEDPVWRLSHELGRALARAGAAVVTGGYGGVMEACSRGAHEEGAHVVGVTVALYEQRGPVNRWVKEHIHTPDLFERLRTIVGRADGYVALPGSVGTLTEVFLTWTLLSARGRPTAPLVLLGEPWRAWLDAHRHPDLIPAPLFERVWVAATAGEAARLVLAGVPAR